MKITHADAVWMRDRFLAGRLSECASVEVGAPDVTQQLPLANILGPDYGPVYLWDLSTDEIVIPHDGVWTVSVVVEIQNTTLGDTLGTGTYGVYIEANLVDSNSFGQSNYYTGTDVGIIGAEKTGQYEAGDRLLVNGITFENVADPVSMNIRRVALTYEGHPVEANLETGELAAFSDTKAGAETITDPEPGNYTVNGDDWASFSATNEADDPSELPDGYVGWVKLVLTEPRWVGIDTNGSGITDTTLWIYDETPTLASTAIQDDDDGGTGSWSAIPGVDEFLVLPADTYWIAIAPFDGSGWDTGEASAVLNLRVL